MKVLHLLASNRYSGAENVVCQIIKMFEGEIEMVYCSPNGDIAKSLKEKQITFFPLNEMSGQEIKKVVDAYKPDIIHAHDIKASVLASKFKDRCKIISHVHGNDKKKMSKLTLKSVLYGLSLKKYSKIFWVSNSCYNDYILKKFAKKNSEILHNIINIEALKKQAEQDKNNYKFDVCYLGRLSEVKNPLRALEIIRETKKLCPNIKCAIVGDGALKEQCEIFICENNLQDNIKMFGFLDNPYKILESSRLLLMSSINEGTPMALIEAFSLGIPVVSTKVDGALELVEIGRAHV